MSAGLWQDQQIRHANERAGWTLCSHCNGTGNELYAMYRACPECGGSGHVGDPPLKVRLADWLRRKRYSVRELWVTDEWKHRPRWWLSYYLGVGRWFWDGRDKCHRCDAMPSDVDFEMRRVAPLCAECADTKSCAMVAEENAALAAQQGHTHA